MLANWFLCNWNKNLIITERYCWCLHTYIKRKHICFINFFALFYVKSTFYFVDINRNSPNMTFQKKDLTKVMTTIQYWLHNLYIHFKYSRTPKYDDVCACLNARTFTYISYLHKTSYFTFIANSDKYSLLELANVTLCIMK